MLGAITAVQPAPVMSYGGRGQASAPGVARSSYTGTPYQNMTPQARAMIQSAPGVMNTSATQTAYKAPASFSANPSSLFANAGLGALTPSLVGGGQQERLFDVQAGSRRGSRATGDKYRFGEQALGGNYGADFGYGKQGIIQGAPIELKGASLLAYEAKMDEIERQSNAEESRWRGKFKENTGTKPIKKKELPNEPMVKTIEGESAIGSLPREASQVYGMGPTRRVQSSSNLGQGNYRLF